MVDEVGDQINDANDDATHSEAENESNHENNLENVEQINIFPYNIFEFLKRNVMLIIIICAILIIPLILLIRWTLRKFRKS